jgi:hypothetical protein
LSDVEPVSESARTDAVLPMGSRPDTTESSYPPRPARRGSLAAGQTSRWFFGRSIAPTRANVVMAAAGTGARIQFGKVGVDGSTRWGPSVTLIRGATSAEARLPSGSAVGLALRVDSGRLPSQQADIEVGSRVYELDGSLSAAVRPGGWRQEGSVDDFTLFVRTHGPEPIHAVDTGGPAPSIEVLSDRANDESIRVRTVAPVVIVRNVAWDAGWHATVTRDGGPAQDTAVSRRGLVQQVRVPAGTDIVTFRYRPPHWLVASAITEGSALLLVLLLADTVLRHRSRRRRRVSP